MTQQAGTAFEASIVDVVRTAVRITRADPRLALRALRLLRRQRAAAHRRTDQKRHGLHVPPFLIYSITDRCNLDCRGCYANLLHRTDRPELDDGEVDRVLTEAEQLGTSITLIAGGEPFLRDALLEWTENHPGILFLLFTNGVLVDEVKVRRLRSQPHVVPVLSLEGDEATTDARRGQGAYEKVTQAMDRLRQARVFFGVSTTLTRDNFELATSRGHIDGLIRRGCRLFYYINYVPVEEGTEEMQLSLDQVSRLEARLGELRRTSPALFIAFPHDEVALGGCLAAGRGFLHINAAGDVQPCPFSPYSDVNLRGTRFEQALRSPLFRKILESDVVLDERDGRCALWKKRDWVSSLVSESEAGTPEENGSPVRDPLRKRERGASRVASSDPGIL